MSTPVLRADAPSQEAYEKAAEELGVDVNTIKAFAIVEAGFMGAFIPDGAAPTILFERHVFDRLTGGIFRHARLPGVKPAWSALSDPTPGGYGPSSIQHPKLVYAVAHDRDAALKSCSWGLFQIMGFNFGRAGYTSLQSFINAMFRSVDDHLAAFVSFIASDLDLRQALRDHNWQRAARLYNGLDFKRSKYDERLQETYADLGEIDEHRRG